MKVKCKACGKNVSKYDTLMGYDLVCAGQIIESYESMMESENREESKYWIVSYAQMSKGVLLDVNYELWNGSIYEYIEVNFKYRKNHSQFVVVNTEEITKKQFEELEKLEGLDN